MPESLPENWITSKDVLLKTGISRATLNNYIKMKIIPKPVVRKPAGEMKGTKKIGYFPHAVLERFEAVKRLKRKGIPMEDIAKRLKDVPVDYYFQDESVAPAYGARETGFVKEERDAWIKQEEGLRLSFENIDLPAYLIDYNFDVKWVNDEAERRIFRQPVSVTKEKESISIFKLLFDWEFHEYVQNWKDVVALHVGFARTVFSKARISKIYREISKTEAMLLEDMYDRVLPFPKQAVNDAPISFLMKDGTTEHYRVYSIFCKEGIFFIYAPSDSNYGHHDRSRLI